MADKNKIYRVVRDPDDGYDQDGVEALTRKRLVERFPKTEEGAIQENALLVRHPYLHPKFERKLLPADRLYEALREEAELEFCEALMELGVVEVKIAHSANEMQRHRTGVDASGGTKGVRASVRVNQEERLREDVERIWKLSLHARPVDIASLDKLRFFGNLVYNKSNRTLELLFDGVKAGKKFKEFQLEFKHSTSRNYELEVQIGASYHKLFDVRLNFEREHETNRVESAIFLAKFPEDGTLPDD